jgi:hypothetical protein
MYVDYPTWSLKVVDEYEVPIIEGAESLEDVYPTMLFIGSRQQERFPTFYAHLVPGATPEPGAVQTTSGVVYDILPPFDTLSTCESIPATAVPSVAP